MSRSVRRRPTLNASLIWVLGLAVGIAIGVLSIYLLTKLTDANASFASIGS